MNPRVVCLLSLRHVRIGIASVCLAVGSFLYTTSADAVPVNFGGHIYQTFQAPGITWNNASVAAGAILMMGVPGHLATITSAAEDVFLDSLRQSDGFNGEMWVGGFQNVCTPEPGCGWQWVNGEGPIAPTNAGPGYVNWLPGEPNDLNGEAHLGIGLGDRFGWNDEQALGNIQGYIVEWDVSSSVPEPVTLALFSLGLGLVGLGGLQRRRLK